MGWFLILGAICISGIWLNARIRKNEPKGEWLWEKMRKGS